jgi:kynurenine formamidase
MTGLPDTMQRQRNWRRWGEADEIGAANLLTPEAVAAAASLVKTGRVFSLALPIRDSNVPVLPGRPTPQHFMRRTGSDYASGLTRKGGFQSVDDVIMLPTHGTTHIDALSHVGDEGLLFNGYPISGIRSNGAAKMGIDRLASLVGRGVMLDLVAHRGGTAPGPGEVILPAELEACAAAQGTPVTPGTILLLRTGWMSVFRDQGAQAFFDTEPGIGLEAARWLAERDVVAVGADNWGVEAIPTEIDLPAPVHRYLLRDCGIYLMELFDLDALAGAGVHEFLFVAAPLRIARGVGSPLNPLAIA